MKLKIKYNVGKWIMWGYAGRVLYPFVLFRDSTEEVSDRLFRHELEHVYQIQADGWWKFHLKYLYELVRYGYKNISYEVGAEWKEETMLTVSERILKDGHKLFPRR